MIKSGIFSIYVESFYQKMLIFSFFCAKKFCNFLKLGYNKIEMFKIGGII